MGKFDPKPGSAHVVEMAVGTGDGNQSFSSVLCCVVLVCVLLLCCVVLVWDYGQKKPVFDFSIVVSSSVGSSIVEGKAGAEKKT